MTTPPGFLADILAHPDDDAPRLILADWLDEHGDPARAEFIRVQCELAKTDPPEELTFAPMLLLPERHHEQTCVRCRTLESRCCPYHALRRRERELWESTWNIRNADFPGWMDEWWWERGFVARVRLSCAAWLEHGPALVRQTPLTRVELSDKGYSRPFGSYFPRAHWFDYGEGENALPPALFLWLAGAKNPPRLSVGTQGAIADCNDDQHALDCLSEACLLWARSQPC